VDGAVVLFHGWPPGTLDALPAIVDGLRSVGATFVRIDELERFADPGAPGRDGAARAPAPAAAPDRPMPAAAPDRPMPAAAPGLPTS
jgi:hypothetical protein